MTDEGIIGSLKYLRWSTVSINSFYFQMAEVRFVLHLLKKCLHDDLFIDESDFLKSEVQQFAVDFKQEPARFV